jgi:hypothetical protein
VRKHREAGILGTLQRCRAGLGNPLEYQITNSG